MLDSLDAVTRSLGRSKESVQARHHLDQAINLLEQTQTDKENLEEVFFGLNIYYRVLMADLESILSEYDTINPNAFKSENARQAIEAYRRRAFLVEWECAKDLRARLDGKTNPGCVQEVAKSMSMTNAGWAGLTLLDHLDSKPVFSTKFREQMNPFLDSINHSIDTMSHGDVSQEKSELGDTSLSMAVLPGTHSDDEQIFILNATVNAAKSGAEFFRFMRDSGTRRYLLDSDHLAFAANKACIEDIRRRLVGERNPACEDLSAKALQAIYQKDLQQSSK